MEPENNAPDSGIGGSNLSQAPILKQQEPRLMTGERIVFTEETQPNEYLKLIANGEINESLLDALDDFIKRQKKRLGLGNKSIKVASSNAI